MMNGLGDRKFKIPHKDKFAVPCKLEKRKEIVYAYY